MSVLTRYDSPFLQGRQQGGRPWFRLPTVAVVY